VGAASVICVATPSNSDTHHRLPVRSRVIKRIEPLARRIAPHHKTTVRELNCYFLFGFPSTVPRAKRATRSGAFFQPYSAAKSDGLSVSIPLSLWAM